VAAAAAAVVPLLPSWAAPAPGQVGQQRGRRGEKGERMRTLAARRKGRVRGGWEAVGWSSPAGWSMLGET
jgi:hypothetical protein